MCASLQETRGAWIANPVDPTFFRLSPGWPRFSLLSDQYPHGEEAIAVRSREDSISQMIEIAGP